MWYRKTIFFSILALSFSFFSTNLYAQPQNERINDFVSIFITASGEYCYRDMAFNPERKSDAGIENEFAKALVAAEPEKYAEEDGVGKKIRIGFDEELQIDVYLRGKQQIVHCDELFPTTGVVFKQGDDPGGWGPYFPSTIPIRNVSEITVTCGNALGNGLPIEDPNYSMSYCWSERIPNIPWVDFETVKITGIDEVMLKLEFTWFGETHSMDLPFATTWTYNEWADISYKDADGNATDLPRTNYQGVVFLSCASAVTDFPCDTIPE